MKRIVVLGGFGLFGRTIVSELATLGLTAVVGSRRGEANLRVDANDAASMQQVLRAGDLVVDAAGPFHPRSTALIRKAIEMKFDVVDINDDLGYAEAALQLAPEIAAAGIRVLSSASSVSAIAAAVVAHSGIAMPRRVTSFLAPASRHTANPGTAGSLWRTIGRPVRVLREGRLETRVGWSETRNFAMPRPLGKIRGHLFESADAIYLPKIWPMLRDVSMYIDSNTFGANTLLQMASNSEPLRELAESKVHIGAWIARKFGSSAGGLGYELEGSDGRISRHAIVAASNSFVAAVAPAVLATRAIATGEFRANGFVLPNQHVSPPELFAYLTKRGITLSDSV
ncbi:MAG TPA: saccharopine dehydrogenase NADP-binding domain-containing protein [Lacipirellulaceae bacterium]|nr:saccharopine dehydrogenase NADP-binding domain-containing protein [Lacipirellulaceae bacterium]